MQAERAAPQPYTGAMLALLTFVLAMANMMEVLDLTIANVAIPTITGDLGVAPTQGAWVITSYAVANAITVPMAGWFAGRFGQVRMYALAIAVFTFASFLCGLSTSLAMLISFRVLQGAAAGFMVPLSQALLLASYPPAKRSTGLAIWGMTIVVAPILGPILGGWITDNYHWSWIFFINIPVGIFASFATWELMRDRETPTSKLPVDRVGMVLLVVWVGALQIMLDKGNELDWFHSTTIIAFGLVALIGFCLFLAWELYEPHPVDDGDTYPLEGHELDLEQLVRDALVLELPLDVPEERARPEAQPLRREPLVAQLFAQPHEVVVVGAVDVRLGGQLFQAQRRPN